MGVSRESVSAWQRNGKGPVREAIPEGTIIHPGKNGLKSQAKYHYNLEAVLKFMASRGASKTKLKAARNSVTTRTRLKLARAADKLRIAAMSSIRRARAAREAAANAGHRPSIKAIAEGEFAEGARS